MVVEVQVPIIVIFLLLEMAVVEVVHQAVGLQPMVMEVHLVLVQLVKDLTVLMVKTHGTQVAVAVLELFVEFVQVRLLEVEEKARAAWVYLEFPLKRLILSVKCAFQMLFRFLECVDDAVGVLPRGVLRGWRVAYYQETGEHLLLPLVTHFQLFPRCWSPRTSS